MKVDLHEIGLWLCPEGVGTYKGRFNPKMALAAFLFGTYWRYPVCCVLRFAYGTLIGEGPQGTLRGGRNCNRKEGHPRFREDPYGRYVVCGIFHKKDEL